MIILLVHLIALLVDVLDARMANELEFSDDGSWIQVSGYNEIDEKKLEMMFMT